MPSRARRLAQRYLHLVPRRLRPKPKPKPGSKKVKARRRKPAPPAAAPREALLRGLERGREVDHAIVAQVRALVSAAQPDTARAVAEGLQRRDATAALGHLTSGIVAYRQGYLELALAELRRVPRELWLAYAAAEYVRAGLAVDPDGTLAEIRALVAEDPDAATAKTWFQILAPVFGFGAQDVARDVFATFERHVRDDPRPWRDGERQVGWMRPWVAADSDSATAPSPGRRTFAIVDYGHPGANRASANIGDHIQTIAALGHLVRHQNVRLHGPDELVGLLGDLRERTRPELRRDDLDADLEVMTVHRDASMYEAVPEDAWVLCFGWYMHALFSMRHGFPLHRNLRPIFISFHCNKRDLLTPEAVDYLKRYGPVGCRDWTTVYLLKSIGVPAFFSGCVTTTINTVFPDAERPPGDAPVGYVDVDDAPADAVTYRHSEGAVRKRSFVANVRRGVDLLETYRRKHRKIVTSRLHCYLPVRSIGFDVDFQPKNRSDVRFDGLLDIDDRAFDAIRTGIRDKLEQVLGAIAAGRPEEEVYALWREITADDVAAAEERRRREHKPIPGPDLGARLSAVRANTITTSTADTTPGEPIHVALIATRGMERPELEPGALVASLLEHASRPLHVWVLGSRGGARPIEQRLARRLPQVTFGWVPTRPLKRDEQLRLLLPDLLPDVDRVVLLPMPAVATADVAELSDLDLGPHAIAAPTRPGTKGVSGFGLIHAAAARLPNRPDLATELRRTAHALHAFDFDAFTSDVMVLDLERLRRERFREQALALAGEFALGELDVLHYLFGPGRAAIPERWAAVPTRTPERAPGLIHWADGVKPWHAALTPERERWRAYANRYRDARGQQVAVPKA
jgi:Glycosyl transferase family 8